MIDFRQIGKVDQYPCQDSECKDFKMHLLVSSFVSFYQCVQCKSSSQLILKNSRPLRFLFQGNMTFGVDGDVTLIENTKLVSVIRDLLSTKEENVEKALLYRTVATGRDVIEKQHTTQEASYGRDALAKVNAGELENDMLLVICQALSLLWAAQKK